LKPIVSFVTFNRAGINAQNLTALLNTTDDFELYIVDNNSTDDTWAFIEQLDDERIKEKKRFDVNRGVVYAMNYVLSHRQQEQYYVHIDSDVFLQSSDWLSQLLNLLKKDPELGIASCVSTNLFDLLNFHPPLTIKDDISYYKLNGTICCCVCFRPELLDILGYWNEETCGADMDLCARLDSYTPYKVGILPSVIMNEPQTVPCEQCIMKELCTCLQKNATCFALYRSKYKHSEFSLRIKARLPLYLEEVNSGKRTPYCASVHDAESIRTHVYNKEWADENFQFFIDNT